MGPGQLAAAHLLCDRCFVFLLSACPIAIGALGGWMSGAIFDLTGSYRAAFANGFLWNLLSIAIIGWLLIRSRARPVGRLAAA
jgi:hypothetical protein